MVLYWLIALGGIGACVGSFLNVCIYRLPLEKSILWPGSHCGHCFQAIRWYDNIPLVSYWLRRGRCRTCGTRFSMRYFFIELLTALSFAGLFYLEIVENVHQFPVLETERANLEEGFLPSREASIIFVYHAALLCFLIVTAFCDLDYREIPLSITVPGTVVGLIGAVLLPWPWPNPPVPAVLPPGHGLLRPPPNLELANGVFPWPVWAPLPEWLAPGSWQLGLATGLAGLLAGTLMLRAIRYLFGLGLGVEALGLGDADLMMMAGSFLGWQPVVVAFFIGVFAGLVFGVAQLVVQGDHAMPFGPALAVGILAAMLGWRWIGPEFQALFFNDMLLLFLGGTSCVLMLVASYLLRVMRLIRQE